MALRSSYSDGAWMSKNEAITAMEMLREKHGVRKTINISKITRFIGGGGNQPDEIANFPST